MTTESIGMHSYKGVDYKFFNTTEQDDRDFGLSSIRCKAYRGKELIEDFKHAVTVEDEGNIKSNAELMESGVRSCFLVAPQVNV